MKKAPFNQVLLELDALSLSKAPIGDIENELRQMLNVTAYEEVAIGLALFLRCIHHLRAGSVTNQREDLSLSDMKGWGEVMSRQASYGDLSTREIDERTELLVRSSDPASLGEVIKVLLRKMVEKCRHAQSGL